MDLTKGRKKTELDTQLEELVVGSICGRVEEKKIVKQAMKYSQGLQNLEGEVALGNGVLKSWH